MSGEGLTVVEIKNKYYCANCGMPIVNTTEWKKIHLAFHAGGTKRYKITIK